MAEAGYSGTPLPVKLGLKDGHAVVFAGLHHLADLAQSRALAGVLVDVKVRAVDAVWSALKLVVRKDCRAIHLHARRTS